MQKVRVYWNLHKYCWSIQSCKTNKVIDYKQHLTLGDGYFVVRKGGQKRVRQRTKGWDGIDDYEKGSKNVHALAVGYIMSRKQRSYHDWDRVKYNPHTDDFFKYHYSCIINRYNREEINILGNQHTLSNIMGGSFYKYNATHHTLLWCNVLPYHIALTDYGYDGGLDFEIGALIQKELTKNLAFYLEAVYLSYFKRKNYNIKTGLNYIIK